MIIIAIVPKITIINSNNNDANNKPQKIDSNNNIMFYI